MKRIFFVMVLLCIVVFLFLHFDTSLIKGNDAFYIGSDRCANCHQAKHESWHNSQHPKIFKKFTDDAQVVADFNNKPDFVKFDKKDIEVIIGGKWEQVFAREIEGEFYPFPAKWMVLTQEWIPYRTDTWQNTPLTQKCDGCHTTGLDVNTGEFSEYGVACESCHGPASRHVENKQILINFACKTCHYSNSENKKRANEPDIVRSIKSAVCGQCHSRGIEDKIMSHQTEIQFNFPVEYLPGQILNKNFKLTSPETDKKSENWWGNGISKNRHQEYADFATSNHARSLKNLRIKRRTACGDEPADQCLKCHSGDYIMAQRYNDRLGGKKKRILPTLENAQDDITCVVCHNPHKSGDVREQTANQCQVCHTKDTQTMKEHEQHFPCPVDRVTCADCHMPKIVQTGGKFSLRSHAFKIIPPQATIKYGMPNSCQNGGCHDDKSTQWAIDEYDTFYKNRDKSKNLIHE